jgi:hypothetical protein
MTGTERAVDDMIGQFEDKWFMMFWYARFVGWMIGRKKSIEKAVESAFTYETDVANLNRAMLLRWTGLPQSMAV